jgi:thiamine biosynthesis lipoprotein
VHIAVVGGDDALATAAQARIRDLERRWSRFLPTSELSRLNDCAGQPVVVSAETFDLVARAVRAWRLTEGKYDPTVGAALVRHGYDRDFADVARTIADTPDPVALPPGAGAIGLMPSGNAVTLPPGVTIDPGGIGKGLAADTTARMLVEGGADGALVNVGGDLRAVGEPPDGDGWVVTVPDPLDPERELLRLAIPAGAVATSSRLQRRWLTTAGEAHHLIDPATGAPVVTDVVAVTVVAGEAWWAEALAKAVFLTGPNALTQLADIHAVVVTADGVRHATADLQATLR